MQTGWNRLAAALTLMLLGASRSWADPVSFSYLWSTSSTHLVGTNPANPATGGADPNPGVSTGAVLVVPASPGDGSAFLDGSPAWFNAAAFHAISSADPGDPDVYGTPFSLALTLTDKASGESGQVVFDGFVNGTLSASSSTLAAGFSGPPTRSLVLGGYLFSVTLGSASLPIPSPLTDTPAYLDAFVQASPADSPVNPVPEPSALLLAGLALPVACARFRRAAS